MAEKGNMPLYQNMALACRKWDTKGNLGLVVGATVPDQLREIRATCPSMPLLIPGVGAQGGDLEAAMAMETQATLEGFLDPQSAERARQQLA